MAATTTMERATAAARTERLALRPEEAAAALGISRAKVYQLLASGEIPSFKLGGNRRVHPDALSAYVARLQGVAGATELTA
jgi:excisionase family DNA binding protein